MATSRSFDIGNKQSGSSRYCTDYEDTGHIKSYYYDLIGYPKWWDPSKALKHKSKTSPATSFVYTTIAEMSSPNTTTTALHISSKSPSHLINLHLLDLVQGLLILDQLIICPLILLMSLN
uniref:Uncharacterized protein n=1 Tax=Populus alba TaxID=43335 RepID=A0A4U5Q176_POPAL|nr:hypothetical protein D5086_0000170600 [Populus alba]